MNAPENMPHEAALELLPWLANGSLVGDEKAAVAEHAKNCVSCRRSLDELVRIDEAIAAASAHTYIPEPDMRSINRRLDRLAERRNAASRVADRLRQLFDSPWRVAFVLQSVAILALGVALFSPREPATPFTTLSNPGTTANGMTIRAVFSPDLGDEEIGRLLDRFGLSVVGGPSARGVYTLGNHDGLTHGAREAIVARLQGEPGVLFAQPAVTGYEP